MSLPLIHTPKKRWQPLWVERPGLIIPGRPRDPVPRSLQMFPVGAFGGFQTLATTPDTNNSVGWAGYCLRTVIPASTYLFLPSGTLTLRPWRKAATAGNNTTITAIYIGHPATAPDFDGGQKLTTSAGLASYTIISSGSDVPLDDVTDFAFDPTKNLMFSIGFATTPASDVRRRGTTGYTSHFKAAAAAEVADTTVSGYSTEADNQYLVSKVEVFV